MRTKIYNTGINLLIAFALLFISFGVSAQYSYQSVLRDGNGDLLVNQTVGMKITVVENYTFPTSNTVNRYVETQTVTTNDNGLVSITIGEGTVVTGDIENVQWGGKKTISGLTHIFTNSIKVEYDFTGGTNYSLTTVEKVLNVPSAAYAESAENATNGAVAMASIKNDATIRKGRGIQSVVWNPGGEMYTVKLTGINFSLDEYVALATIHGGQRIINVSAMGGDVLVYIYDLNGNRVKNDFQLVVFKP